MYRPVAASTSTPLCTARWRPPRHSAAGTLAHYHAIGPGTLEPLPTTSRAPGSADPPRRGRRAVQWSRGAGACCGPRVGVPHVRRHVCVEELVAFYKDRTIATSLLPTGWKRPRRGDGRRHQRPLRARTASICCFVGRSFTRKRPTRCCALPPRPGRHPTRIAAGRASPTTTRVKERSQRGTARDLAGSDQAPRALPSAAPRLFDSRGADPHDAQASHTARPSSSETSAI